ncbi:MAG: terminase small subunit [Gammaproteobacteria bacterium]|nr:terminase small subunit [Gammaproteobacteria bacterium]
MAKPKMTHKQALFAKEYLKDLNGTQAAIRAGYSKKTARSQAQRLLTKVAVTNAIQAGCKKRLDKVEVDTDWVLQRLVEEAEADVADLYQEGGGLKPPHEWPMAWRKGLVAGVDVHFERGDDGEAGTTTKVRLSDRIKRIELIGKHVDVQAFQDKLAVEGNMTLAERMAEAKERTNR